MLSTGTFDGFADRHGPLSTEATSERVTVTAADGSVAWITVPFPPFDPDSPRTLTRLQLHVAADRRIGVLLVRRGGYAAGIFIGSKLVSSKVGSGYVQGTTKAGGWSQQRYARRRSNQAHAAFAEAADIAARILLPESARLDGIVCGAIDPPCEPFSQIHDWLRFRPLSLSRTSRWETPN